MIPQILSTEKKKERRGTHRRSASVRLSLEAQIPIAECLSVYLSVCVWVVSTEAIHDHEAKKRKEMSESIG